MIFKKNGRQRRYNIFLVENLSHSAKKVQGRRFGVEKFFVNCRVWLTRLKGCHGACEKATKREQDRIDFH